MQLQQGTTLQGGKYRIEKVLGQGGFGITYLAKLTTHGLHVCIKEFFMKDLCLRNETTLVAPSTTKGRNDVENYRRKFLREARIIFDFNHPAIARCFDFFEENNTAYYVMDYIDGHTLLDTIKARGPLPEAEAEAYIRQVAEALAYIHGHHINHLDIKPSNIMMRSSDNRAIVIDFGLAKHYDEGSNEQTTSTLTAISRGYAPIEQYRQGGVSTFSPPTDIYALGATLYYLLTGTKPPQATDLVDATLAFPAHVSARMQRIISAAMAPRRTDRPATIAHFLDLFNEAKTATAPAVPAAPAPPSTSSKPPKAPHLTAPAAPTGPTDPEEQYQFGKKYYHGYGVKQDYNEAVKWYRKAAEQGHADAQYNLGECYNYGYGVKKDYNEAVKWYRKAAEQGDADAQYNLGFCYRNGYGVKQDYNEAVKWYRKAAEQGHTDAQNNLGECYCWGRDVRQDYDEAVKWYRKAAEQGHADAQYNLGFCYYCGYVKLPYTLHSRFLTTPLHDQHYEEAVKWYRKAAEQGHTYAQSNLGECYYYGYGVKQNYDEAVKWYRKAAEQGHAKAQNGLGVCYLNGYGVKQNYDEAVKWYRKAAGQRYAKAQNGLGVCYLNGYGVKQDYAEAVKWFLIAEGRQGDADALYWLGYCYNQGKGVKISRKMAKWYWQKAEEKGHSEAKSKLRELNSDMRWATFFFLFASPLIGLGIFAFFREGWLNGVLGCFCISLAFSLFCVSYDLSTHKVSPTIVFSSIVLFVLSGIGLGIFAFIAGNWWLMGVAACGLIGFRYFWKKF